LLGDVARVLFETGLRPDECHRLEWPDINFATNRLLVHHGKTPAARRLLPLTQNVRAVLESRWQAADCPETGFAFPGPTQSGHIEHYTLKKQHRRALKKSGVREFLLYSLRHSFATRIAPRVDAWTLCRIMGGASLSVAMTYVHAQDDRVLSAFSRAEEISGHVFGHVGDSRIPSGKGKSLQLDEEPDSYLVSAAGFEPATHASKVLRAENTRNENE
jgi:integrase